MPPTNCGQNALNIYIMYLSKKEKISLKKLQKMLDKLVLT